MSESLRLVHETNNLLDSIDESREYEEKNLEELQHLKNKMVAYGFNSPLKDIIAKARENAEAKGADELADQKKQMGNIRYISSLKKFTLNRLRVAISAHKIAKALEDFKEEEMIEHLPLGGSYKQSLTLGGDIAVIAYHELINLFEQRKNPLRSASALVSFLQDGVEVERKIQLDADSDAKKKIKEMFGPDAQIKDVELKKRTAGLIKNYSTKVALFTMACVQAAKRARQRADDEQRKDSRLSEYNQILKNNGIVQDSDITASTGFESLKRELERKGFVKRLGFSHVLDTDLEPKLHKRRERKRRETLQVSSLTVFRLLGWYYLTMHEQARRSYPNLPSVIAKPEKEHLAILDDLAPATSAITMISDTLAEKIEFEKRAPPISSSAWGPAFLCIKKDLGSGVVASEFNLDKGEIEAARPVLKSLIEKPQGRGAQFLDDLKK